MLISEGELTRGALPLVVADSDTDDDHTPVSASVEAAEYDRLTLSDPELLLSLLS